MDSKGKTIDFLKILILEELKVTNQTQTLFRSNSYATKNIDIYMKRHGKVFMKKVMESMLVYIRNPGINCELDPERLANTDTLETNIENLERCCGLFLGDLLKNIHLIPLGMRDLFTFIRSNVADKFSSTRKTAYTSIGCFLFLRFFGPAIVSPNNYGLIEGNINLQMRRNLILVSKTIQNLSNFVKFGAKEPYMKVMNNFMEKTHSNLELIIDLITNPETLVPKFIARGKPFENACDADTFGRILMKAEKSHQFLEKFRRKTDVLLLLRSIERKKDVLSAKIQSGMIAPLLASSAEESIKSPPPRQSSAGWKPSEDDLSDPETAGIKFDDEPRRTSRRSKSINDERSSSFSDDQRKPRRNSYRVSAISMLSSISSSISELDDELGGSKEETKTKALFGTVSRSLRRSSNLKK